MKSFNLFVAALVFAVNAFAADALTEKLQRGLFEEEANHNLDAAIKEYQSVVAQSDEQRKVIATALFRLGECYRKLGKTNEANVQYLRLLRDFSEQEQLMKLANDLVKPSVSVAGQPSELIRELQRRIANLRVQSISGQMETDQLRAMTRQDFLNSDATKGDARLASLRATDLELEQKAAALKVQFSDEHPDVKAVTAQQKVVAEQIDEALKGILVSAQGRAASLAAQLKALDTELKNAETELREPNAPVPSWKTVSDPEQVRLLQEELKLAEQKVRALESITSDRVPPGSVLNAKRDVLAVRRLLPENSSLPRQRSLLNEQVKIVEQLLNDANESVKAGRASPTEVISLRRESLALQREIAGLTEGSAASATAVSAQSGMTQAEAEALARAKTLARNSPDLLQNPTRDGLGELQLGARDGFYSVVEFILTQGVSANGPERGMPPIVLAAKGGHLRIVQMLLDKGADVNAIGGGNTALMAACENGYRAVVELLLQRGADVNRAGNGMALHKAAAKGYAGLVELLLQRGANPDAPDTSSRIGGTALHLAATGGFADVAGLLLKAGASPTMTNGNGSTPLHLAVSRGDTNIATRLLGKGANPNAEDSEGQTPIYRALSMQRPVEMVRLLLARGADVNRRHIIKDGSRQISHYPLIDAIANGQQEVVDAMLAAKADLEVVNQGFTPLMVAVRSGRTGIVESVLRAGADPNLRTESWDPPLFHALDQAPMAATLLKHGADPNIVSQRGHTAMASVTQPEILQLLLDHKADPNKGNPLPELLRRRTSSPQPLTFAIGGGIAAPPKPSDYPAIEVLLKGGANPNTMFSDGTKLLTWAVSNADGKLVDLLLKHGAEVNYVVGNETPLSLAQRNVRSANPAQNSAQAIEEVEQIEKALREHGANEYLQRLSTISYTRPAWTSGEGKTVFSRGTNDYNRHTLFEMLAAVFTGNDQPAFPELSRVTIERLEGANPKRRELAINIDELLRANDCSKDTWLEWGDRLSFPESDHPLNEAWPGLPQETFGLLTKCLTRKVSIIVKQETNTVKLVPSWGGPSGVMTFGTAAPGYGAYGGIPVSQPLRSMPFRVPPQPGAGTPVQEKSEKVLYTFRLKEVVYGANVLRASSDAARVRVTRRDGNESKDWMFDLTKIATSSEWNSSGVPMAGFPGAQSTSAPRRLSPSEDLWLRDGNVIEIPEKQ